MRYWQRLLLQLIVSVALLDPEELLATSVTVYVARPAAYVWVGFTALECGEPSPKSQS